MTQRGNQPNGIDGTEGAHITGVRLVFTYGTGKIRQPSKDRRRGIAF